MPMKVTVCFDHIRVIVPCGEGDIPVRDLIQKAVTRYKKATGKANNYWVAVHCVKTLSGGGILDPDDTLNDVVDDREQLIADFEEQGRPGIHHNGGDGASASSTGTASPDIFQGGEVTSECLPSISTALQNGKNDIVVTAREFLIGSNLKVRRGSEPALNTLVDDINENGDMKKPKSSYPVNRTKEDARESDTPRSDTDSEEDEYRGHRPLSKKPSPLSNFSRDSVRQSLSNRPEMFRWLEAQEKQQAEFNKKVDERTAPVGGSGLDTEALASKQHDISVPLVLKNDGGPLGIHVIPDLDDRGSELGLMIQSIEKGGKIQRDGRLQVRDRITEINGVSLYNVSFDNAQTIFRDAMKTDEIRLRVVKYQPQPVRPPTLPKPKGHAPVKPSPLTLPPRGQDISPIQSPNQTSSPTEKDSEVARINTKNVNVTNISSFSNVNNVARMPKSPLSPRANMPIPAGPPLKISSPTKKTPPAVPARHPSTTLSVNKAKDAFMSLANTRKIGKKISIDLVKGPLGLGFSVTSRDNPTSPQCPIYIKNILPEGAAVADGRLRSGDRLLEVNGIEMTGKSQAEAVALLRKIETGSNVNLVVSRQEVVDEMFQVPRELTPPVDVADVTDGTDVTLQPPDKVGEDVTLTGPRQKEVITLEIPLNDSGSAGLGVSVKGKTTGARDGNRDLGIFIKSVMNGGAASKDGRLAVNDQLLKVNGTVLSNLSNIDAMNALRQAMQTDGQVPGYITITVARKIGAPSPFHFSESSSDNMDTSQPETIGNGMHIYTEKTHHKSNNGNSNSINNNNNNNNNKVPQPKERKFVDVTQNAPAAKPQNKMLERLLAADTKGLRNESYNRAVRDHFQSGADNSSGKLNNLQGLTVSPKESQDVVIVEDDMYALPRKKMQPVRPHSTLGIPIKRSPPDSHSSSFDEFAPHSSHSDQSSEQLESEISPVTGEFHFDREGFGRQSMSEKRKGHLDPRQCEFYQRAKEKNKEIKAGLAGSRDKHDELNRMNQSSSAESLTTSRPSKLHDDSQTQYPSSLSVMVSQPTLKRSSSLEDLSIQGKEEDEEKVPVWRVTRMGRQRACNDSFRAAVDRSYDPQADHSVMDTPSTVEEESVDSGSVSYGQSNSARSSFSSENTTEPGSGDFHSLRKKKNKEKKGGILKGFLRFGRGRKSNEDNSRRSRSAERPQDADVKQRQIEDEERAWKQSKDDHFKPRDLQAMKEAEIFDIQKMREEHQRVWDKPLFEKQKEKEDLLRTKAQPMFDNQRLHLPQQMFYDPQTEGESQTFSDQRKKTWQQQAGNHRQQEDGSNLWQHQDGNYRQQEDGNHRQQQQDSNHRQQEDASHWPPQAGNHWQYQSHPAELSRFPQTSDLISQALKDGNLKRADKIQLLRAEHQRRHQERQGRYPLDEREELIERELRQAEEEKQRRLGQENPEPRPPSRGYPQRPGSRQGMEVEGVGYGQRPAGSDPSHPGNTYYTNHHSASNMNDHRYLGNHGNSYSNEPLYPGVSEQSYPSKSDRQFPILSDRPYPSVSDCSDVADRGGNSYQTCPPPQYSGPHNPNRGGNSSEFMYRNKDIDNNPDRRTAFARIDSPFYGDPSMSYHDPSKAYHDPSRVYRDPSTYPVAGRRPVQTITDPNSAKV